MSTATEKIRQARDLLLSYRGNGEAARRDFVWPDITGSFNWAVDWFDAIGRGNQKRALWIREEDGSEQVYTFDQMVTRSDRVATWLRQHGLGRGDTVMLMLGNQVEMWDVMLAVMKIGAVILPTAEAVTPDDLRDRIPRARVKAAVVNPRETWTFDDVDGDYLKISTGQAPQGWLALEEAYDCEASSCPVVTEVGDPCIMYFTSGTTKSPKLVEHNQLSYPVGHLSTMYMIGVRPGDVHLNISAPGWGKHAWSSFFAPWIAEATIFIYNYSRFDAEDLLAQIRNADIASFCAPPTVWRMMIQADLGERPASLRDIIGAGEPLNAEVISQVQAAWGLTIRDTYGQTETTAQIGNVPDERVKPGSMGKPLPGVPVEIRDPETGEFGDVGEICLRVEPWPLNLMTRYVDMPELQERVIRDGYYHTGDLVTRDAEGYITYVGRTDDVFKASDYKVSPFELESVLMEHPAVAEVAVVPSPDPLRLAVPKAYVTLAKGYEPAADIARSIMEYGRDHLAPYLRVRRVEFDELPKTLSGKIRRVVLRAREQEKRRHYTYEDFPELRTRGS